MPSSDSVVRFAVRTGDRRAATWRIWSARNARDVYLLVRETGQTLKVSFHLDTGDWAVAFTNHHVETDGRWIPERGRRFQRFGPPAETVSGVVEAYRILVPTEGLRVPVAADDDRIRWFDPKGAPATVFSVFFIAAGVDAVPAERLTEIGRLKIIDGGSAVVTAMTLDEMPQLDGSAPGPLDEVLHDLAASDPDTLRVIGWGGPDEHGRHWAIDSAIDITEAARRRLADLTLRA